MPFFRAAWLLPISQPPIRDGWLHTENGRIVAYGHSRPGDFTPDGEIDLGHRVVMPALVNAHTHLELSWMRGSVPPADRFGAWIDRVLSLRSTSAPPPEIARHAIRIAMDEVRASGTGLVGDITNTMSAAPELAAAGFPAAVFFELLGFLSSSADSVIEAAVSAIGADVPAMQKRFLAPHAPYSVSPDTFRRVKGHMGDDPRARTSVHLGESREELDFLMSGGGPFRTVLDRLGKWDPSWKIPACGPVEYLERLSFIDERVLVVHGVWFDEQDVARVADAGATIVTCPRGNRLTGAGTPPVGVFFEQGATVAVGTDSLASVPNLNLFSELEEMRKLATDVPARRLLEAATINGARALAFDDELGTMDAGKRAALIAVDPGEAVSNVEEWLVSGIQPSQIRWLET